MTEKKWLIASLSLLFSILLLVGFINYYMDPAWIFDHENAYNQRQSITDERMEKSNHIAYTNKKYNGLIIGSSISTLINQKSFSPKKIFNYSASAMTPEEFEEYINFFKKKTKNKSLDIFLGMDFLEYFNNNYRNNSPNEYFKKTEDYFHRLKVVLSINTFKRSLRNLANNFRSVPGKYYNRHNEAMVNKVDKEIVSLLIKDSIRKYPFTNLIKNKKYASTLVKLRNQNKSSNFFVFTTPISSNRINHITSSGLYDHYESWLKDLVEIFGEVYHFMYLNETTLDSLNNYSDSYHFYPEVGEKIATVIRTKKITNFGILINKNNLKEQLKKLKSINKAK